MQKYFIHNMKINSSKFFNFSIIIIVFINALGCEHIEKKLSKKKNTVKELYNLNKDLGEENDLADLFPEDVKRLDSLREKWNKQLIDPISLGLIHAQRCQKRLKKVGNYLNLVLQNEK